MAKRTLRARRRQEQIEAQRRPQAVQNVDPFDGEDVALEQERPPLTPRQQREAAENRKHKRVFKTKAVIWALIFSVLGTWLVTSVDREKKYTQYPSPSKYFYVEDYSGVFAKETEDYIMEQAVALQKQTGAQIVVVSVPNTHKDSIERYSTNLFNQWGIGDKEKDNGILILFTTEDPHVRFEVGKGLEGAIPDSVAGSILDEYAVDAKDHGRWNEAALNTFSMAAYHVYNEYGLEAPESLCLFEENEIDPPGKTYADLDFPEERVVVNERPVVLQVILAFFKFWAFNAIPFAIFLALMWNGVTLLDVLGFILGLFFGGGGGGGSSGGGGFSGGGGGGYSGGGGSSGGGGATR